MYSFLNTFAELPYTLALLSGEYQVVPLLEVFGYDVPVWEAASIVTSSPVVQVTSRTQTARTKKYTEGTFVLQGLMMDDQVEFELVTDSTLVQRGSCRWDDTLLDSYPHVISESTEAWEGCGGKVEIEEESVGGAEQTLGPEQMGSRTYKYHSDLLWYTRYTGSFKKNSDGAWNTDRYTTDSEGNMKGKSGSYSYVAAQEVNVYRAKITRGNQVRYGPRIQFVGSQKYNTFNGRVTSHRFAGQTKADFVKTKPHLPRVRCGLVCNQVRWTPLMMRYSTSEKGFALSRESRVMSQKLSSCPRGSPA